jgi:DNA-binding MarR family transcriptional regulator
MRSDPAGDASDAETDYPNRELVEAAAAFAGAFHRWLDALAPDGRTYPELRLIGRLHCQGPAKMRDLADDLGLSARNMTALADALEADGLVRRAAHPSDRRATLLELTRAGTAAAEEALTPHLVDMGRLFDSLSPSRRTALLASLRILNAEMSAATPPRARPPAA